MGQNGGVLEEDIPEGYVVYCRMSDEPGANGIGAVYVEKDAPGVSFWSARKLDGLEWHPIRRHLFRQCRSPC